MTSIVKRPRLSNQCQRPESTATLVLIAGNGDLNFLNAHVANTFAQLGATESLDRSVTESNVASGVMDVFVPAWLRSRQGRGIIATSSHAETENDSLADVGSIRVGDVTIT